MFEETARTLKAREKERVVELDGLSYKVRRLEPKEVLLIRGGIPDLAAEESGRGGTVRDLTIAEAFVTAGLIDPAVGEGEDEIAISDIPFLHLIALSGAIGDLAGVSKEAAGRVRPLPSTEGSA